MILSRNGVSPVESTVENVPKNYKILIDDITADRFSTKTAHTRDRFTDPPTVKTTADLPPADNVKLRGVLKKRTGITDITEDRTMAKTTKRRVRFAGEIVTDLPTVKRTTDHYPPNTAMSSRLFVGKLPKKTTPPRAE